MKKVINQIKAIDIILSIEGKFFTVEFIKKDNTVRKMNCRTQVKKHLKGGKLAYNPIERNLLPVFDLQKQGYRMINLNSLVSLTFKGTTYKIE